MTYTSQGSAAGEAGQVAALWRRVRWGAAAFCAVQFAVYVPAPGIRVPWPLPALGVGLAALVAAVNLGAQVAERRRPRSDVPGRVARRDLVLLGADTAVVVTVVQIFAFEPTSAVWVLLVVPVLEAALIGRMRWALSAWGAAVAALVLREVLAVAVHRLPVPGPQLLLSVLGFRIGLLLLVATAVGVQASVAHEHLRRLRDAQALLAHEAGHDHLTGLVTRRLFLDRAGRALAAAPRRADVGVLFVDCDSFKAVNDRYGHAAGDEVLQQVADRLRAVAAPDDTAARLGGDEFAVLVLRRGGAAGGDGVQRAARDVRAALARPYQVGGREVVLMGCSVGLAVAGAGDELSDLLSRADEAMYSDKHGRTMAAQDAPRGVRPGTTGEPPALPAPVPDRPS